MKKMSEPLSDLTTTPDWWDTYQGVDAAQAERDITGQILDAITNHPRSLQKRIGPSEIGNPCAHCLAARLAGWEKTELGVPWTTTKGTAVHFWLEHLFMDADTRRPDYVARGHKKRWVCEETVWVGDIGDTPITGSTDLFDLHAGQTVDWKFVGQNSLKKYRAKGPSDTYRVQAHLYGRGWERRGCKVNAVSILFLPAQSAAWGDHFWWSEPYDEQIALAALERANHLDKQIRTLRAFAGEEAVTQWISGLDRADGCFDCRKYPDYTPPPQTEGGVTFDL